MSVIEIHATVSHRYYMRKRKAEITQRIDDMLARIPRGVVREHFNLNQQSLPAIILYYRKIGSRTVLPDHFLKFHVASAAMLAHDLIDRCDRMPAPEHCRADCDGMCEHPKCPQFLDGEPQRSGRHCPLDNYEDE